MTVVNPKSISGINSITMASGSDDLLTIHSNNTTERVRVNNSGDVIIGSGVTLSPDGDVFATGVYTATSFSGDGSNLTGISAGKFVSETAGISTNTPVGVNTSTVDDNDLTGIGNSFKGLYVANGMVIHDSELTGTHYIGTSFRGMMAGPVSIAGTLTVDGNYVVV